MFELQGFFPESCFSLQNGGISQICEIKASAHFKIDEQGAFIYLIMDYTIVELLQSYWICFDCVLVRR